MAANEFLQYFRLRERPRVAWMCNPAFDPPPSLLRAIFGQDILDDELPYYKKEYHKDCHALVNLYMDRLYRKKIFNIIRNQMGMNRYPVFQWNGGDLAYGQLAEFMVNNLLSTYQNIFYAWTEYFTITPAGKLLTYFLFEGSPLEQMYGLAVFFIYLSAIYFFSEYDDVYFNKQIFDLLPSVEPIFERYPLLRETYIKFALKQITRRSFMLGLKTIMITVYHVPAELIDGFFIDEDGNQFDVNDSVGEPLLDFENLDLDGDEL
jgi:hypothetical protein